MPFPRKLRPQNLLSFIMFHFSLSSSSPNPGLLLFLSSRSDNGRTTTICNILLLQNAIQLDSDAYEVSQDRLLHLVADRLLESNCNVKSKDEGYVSNQQQNISDTIDLLPCLATGIDVNVLFRKINDFELTRECAIFDLLDIGLYRGWIVEPEVRIKRSI